MTSLPSSGLHAQDKELVIFAAASMKNALDEAAAGFSKQTGKPAPKISYAASNTLAKQIEAGAPADILLFRRDPTQSLDNLASLEAVIAAGRLYRSADLAQALHTSTAYFNSPLIKPLARRGAEQALARALGPARK